MTIVDTHCHTGIHKYEPIDSLLFHMEKNGVGKAVLIQHAGETDNSYHIECLRQHPDRFASAMIVAPDDDGARIRHWAEQGIIGIRLPASSRATSDDPLSQWRTAAELDLVVSAPCNPAALLSEEFSEVLRLFPTLHIVIEHLGGVGQNSAEPYGEFKRVLQLAERPNLSIKLPGFGEFCSLPFPFAHVPPLAEMAIEAFGPERVMWGSDYPPVSSREGYAHSLHFPQEYLAALSESERAWIFGESALKIWRFPQS
ncbi:MAG: L-fuconolactonase [Candidatus Latescibacterota bacterium]|jgi:L-fuconolactonase